MLSVVTPWGQYQLKFLPEGVGPASIELQRVMASIFSDFTEWCIVLFDNILVLAVDAADGLHKLDKIFNRRIDRNIFLKFSKSFIGFDYANFFGYVLRNEFCELSKERKAGLEMIPFPSNTKQMQSFIGVTVFFKSFTPNYSKLAAPLTDMMHNDFNWTESTWTRDYRKDFELFKNALMDAQARYYPDYSLPWILRTDASKVGVGSTLFMRRTILDGTYEDLPISFSSQKFSSAAQNWSTIEQEAYGIYFGVKSNEFLLRCKEFILETDHNNLRWIEAS